MIKRTSGEKPDNTEKESTPSPNNCEQSIGKSASANHPSEEPQGKEKLPEGSSWMEDPEFYKMLLKRRADSKGRKRDVKDIFGE